MFGHPYERLRLLCLPSCKDQIARFCHPMKDSDCYVCPAMERLQIAMFAILWKDSDCMFCPDRKTRIALFAQLMKDSDCYVLPSYDHVGVPSGRKKTSAAAWQVGVQGGGLVMDLRGACHPMTPSLPPDSPTPSPSQSPPPLFPITLTQDQEEIKKIRFLVLQESSKLKEVLDASRVGMDTNQLLLELEEKRVALDERESDSRNKRIQRLITLKGQPRGTVNPPPGPPPGPPSLLCTLFDQFFAPSLITPEPEFTDFEDFLVTDDVGSHLSVLSDLLLFRPRHTWDTEQRKPTSDLDREDHNLLQELVKKQQEKQAGVGGGRAGGGAGRLADMPVFAPNCATVGAVLSMVVHLPVLTEIATGQFLFQK
ncbi:hypothetical protein GWK47_024726 [Chionoecetes opilio]|uniref:Uncharacterized protein n=1 Tax=Chionoecetes opilio TaxID=41210 RepID=A0A8J4XL40_CHIOP|nr:hypothetical protein GWK47_024726 [Chionoecetes opilio]